MGGNYLAGVATDEGDTTSELRGLAENLALAMEKKLRRPANFYGVGGMKIFRDLIYVMQGLMKADHKFYKEHGSLRLPAEAEEAHHTDEAGRRAHALCPRCRRR